MCVCIIWLSLLCIYIYIYICVCVCPACGEKDADSCVDFCIDPAPTDTRNCTEIDAT